MLLQDNVIKRMILIVVYKEKMYTTYECSQSVSIYTKTYLTLNSFQNGGDEGRPSECDNQYHSNNTPIVALSIGWFNNGSRCLKNITISANGKSVVSNGHGC
jgi:hypothetical protein